MRGIFALVLMAGIALAGLAVYMAQGYLSQKDAEVARATAQQQATGELVRVFAAYREMPFGTALTKKDVRVVFAQKKALAPGTFLVDLERWQDEFNETGPSSAALFPENDERPRMLTRSVIANEILLASRVTEPGKSASLTGKLDKGLRAFQIKLTTSGVQTFVMPDTFIDIYWTGSLDGQQITRLIESALRVIAVDNISTEGQARQGNASTVTVAATPEQVARLAQAQASGQLTMSLAGSEEDAVAGLVEINRDSLLGITREKAAPVVKQESCSVKTRKGGEVVEVSIPCTD